MNVKLDKNPLQQNNKRTTLKSKQPPNQQALTTCYNREQATRRAPCNNEEVHQ
jgi:hypothetical protein